MQKTKDQKKMRWFDDAGKVSIRLSIPTATLVYLAGKRRKGEITVKDPWFRIYWGFVLESKKERGER